jgi:hypothetical protein
LRFVFKRLNLGNAKEVPEFFFEFS